MRVTERMLFGNVSSRLQKQSASLLRLQEQISGGKKINKPSDDPIGQADIINFEKSLEMSDQYLRNIDRLESSVVTSETALQTVQEQLVRIRELAVQAANATNTSADRMMIAQEVRQIYDQLVSVANTNHEGSYIFAGNKVKTQPFVSNGTFIGTSITSPTTITAASNDVLNISLDGITSNVTIPPMSNATGPQLATAVETAINGATAFQSAGVSVSVTFDTDHLVFTSKAVGGTSAATPNSGTAFSTLVGAGPGTNRPAGTYLGDSAENAIMIGKNTSVVKNLPGARLFKGAVGGTDVFEVLGNFQIALETNNLSGIQAELGRMDAMQDAMSDERALIGARLNRTEAAASMLEDFKVTVARLKSSREDVDLSSAISDLVFQQTILDTTRAIAARVVQRSLLDFLR